MGLHPMWKYRYLRIAACGIVAWFCALAPSASWSAVECTVLDSSKKPVSNAVITLKTAGVKPPVPAHFSVQQKGTQFEKEIVIVPVGSTVNFPNKDQVRHHIYSHSVAKKFEIPLAETYSAPPITFEKSGFVAIGCNIHDWMITHIAVVDTPYYAQTGLDGSAVLDRIPDGTYTVSVWHPASRDNPDSLKKEIRVEAGRATISYNLNLRPMKSRIPPDAAEDDRRETGY